MTYTNSAPAVRRVPATLACFLAYFTISAVISPLGIVSLPMAGDFGVQVTATSANFSNLTFGILIGCILAIFLTPTLGSRWINIACGGVLILCLLVTHAITTLGQLALLFLLAGTCLGLMVSTAVSVLSALYEDRNRARAMLATDGFYSGSGVISGFVAGQLIAGGSGWPTVYLLAAGVAVAFVALSFATRFPDHRRTPDALPDTAPEWTPGVLLTGAALLVYLIGFIIIYSWIPPYAADRFGVSADAGGALVSRFFLGLFIGQVSAFFLSFAIGLRPLVLGLLVAACVATNGLWLAPDPALLGYAMLALGMVSGGVLKTLITYGTTLTASLSPRVPGFLVLMTAVGSSISPAAGAWFVRTYDMTTALHAITVSYLLTAILVAVAASREPASRPASAPDPAARDAGGAARRRPAAATGAAHRRR